MADSIPLNTALLTQGFGSYLTGILPNDIATACGAFSATMRQVRNINNVPIEKLAQVVPNIETTNGLNLINGTDVPVNVDLANAGAALVALGSGPDGTYTMSDFFGAMSGLPYPLTSIKTSITDLQTSTLASIYSELFLAVTWDRATASVQYTSYVIESPPTVFTTWYHVTGVTITDSGGGYGRGGAAAPTVTMTGGTCTSTIGTDNTNAGPNSTGTFGRVTALNFTSGADITSVPTISIDYPPGGSSFSNTIVQGYIDDANAEIVSIKNNNPVAAQTLNTLWNIIGTQLSIEQRARVTAIPPVPVPQDSTLSQFPTSIMAFVDAIPNFALNTLPHMYAQTLEAISDWKNAGGQSVVGMMRQERNQTRLLQAGIVLDNNLPGTMTATTAKLLLANGTVSVAAAGVPIDSAIFTIPSNLSQVDENNNQIVPNPIGFYDNNNNGISVPNAFMEATALGTLLNLPNATPGSDEAGFSPINNDNGQNPNVVNPITNRIPSGSGTLLDVGKANVPGSLAGSQYQNTIPPELQVAYSASTLTPSTYSIPDAIDQVIHCNCDCWVQ